MAFLIPARRGARRLAFVLLAALAGPAFVAPAGRAAAEAPRPEAEEVVVAKYLVAFLRYVAWPEPDAPGAETPRRIGVVGDDMLGAALDRTLAGRKLGGRPLATVRAATVDQLGPCDVVFVGGANPRETQAALRALAGRRVLTVGFAPAPDAPGGHAAIELVRVGNNLRYRIHPEILSATGLRPTEGLLANALRPGGAAGETGGDAR